MRERACLRCHVTMATGYLLDRDSGVGGAPTQWVEGEPVYGWIKNLKVKDTLEIISYRCPKCGALELVAPDPQEPVRGGISLSEPMAQQGALTSSEE